MPELPEVETMRRGVAGIVGSTIAEVRFPVGQCKPITVRPSRHVVRRELAGRVITQVSRLGKRVVLELGEHRLIIEPRMTGLLSLADLPTQAHARMGLRLTIQSAQSATDHGNWLWFWDRRGLGRVEWMSDAQWRRWRASDSIGPDALEITSRELEERLGSSRRAIKVALLDQRALAGIGNLYASELLFAARVHPMTRCDQLNRSQWRAIHRAMLRVLRAAVRYEGSTLGDGTYRDTLNRTGRYQHHHRVYARSGQPCRVCRQGTIQRVVQAQRSTFYCPSCQRS